MNERARAENEVRRIFGVTETRGLLWRALFDHAFQFIGLVSVDGLLLEANQASLAAIGCTRDEVIGRPFWELPWWQHSAAAVARLREAIERARGGQFDRFETTHVGTDGRVIAVDFSLSPVLDDAGKVLFLVPEGRDITDRKRYERQRAFVAEAGRLLSESLDRDAIFERLAHHLVPELADVCVITVVENGEASPIAVAHRDPDREPTLRELARPFAREAAGEFAAVSVIAAGRAAVYPSLDTTDWDGAVVPERFPRLMREIGARSVLCVPLRSRRGVLGVMSLFVTTEGRRHTAEDLELVEDLAQRAAAAVENVLLYEEARRAVTARDDLIATISHDLRNPLNSIVLAAALVTRVGAPAAEHGERILNAATAMNRMIQDLLDLAKIEAGHLTITRMPEAPHALIHDAVELMESQAAARSVELRVEMPDEAPRVLCERHSVRRVFSNLIGNAIKFSPDGASIVLRVTPAKGEVRFEVHDTGPGIPAEALARIFDRYWQARQTANLGTGLGLSIAKGIVEAHGGRIWVESTLGTGSSFYFTLLAEET